MVNQEIPRKLAVLLHADVVDSTNLVRINEMLADELNNRFIRDDNSTARRLCVEALAGADPKTSDH